jgi:hypothetical protein
VVLRTATILALLLVATGCGSSSAKQLVAGLPVVVLQSRSAPSWVRLLRSAGYAAHDGDLVSLLARTGGVVPADAALSSADRSHIVSWVQRGGRLATANSALLQDLHIERSAKERVAAVVMKGTTAQWPGPLWVHPLSGSRLTPLARSSTGGVMMATTPELKGGVVAFAIDPAGSRREGYELMPYVASLTGANLRAPVGPKSSGSEILVDPGVLPRGVGTSPLRVARLLQRAGAGIAEIAGWNYDFNDPANDYDYAGLIRALHARGILAYLWLEPPLVTLRLWQDHPECRERTQTGANGPVFWRSEIALEDPACFVLATRSWTRIVTRYPWDGVNVAELYFEGPKIPADYVPFSRAALAQFGHNPATDPAGFATFRTNLVTSLNRRMLGFLNGLPNAKRRALELTVIDDSLDPAQGRATGSNVLSLAGVARHGGASLIVEDPYTTWADGPLRYDKLVPHVASLMPPGDTLLDVNVVVRAAARPTLKMTGAELTLALGSAAGPRGHVSLYSLGTVLPQDLGTIPGALASSVSTTDLGTYGRQTVTVTAPFPTAGRLTVDGFPWPVARGKALIPPGNHLLTWSAGRTAGPGLVSFTGELGTIRMSTRTLTMTYESRPDALAVLTRRPRSLQIDGGSVALVVQADPDGGDVVRLPSGRHTALLLFG